MAIMERTALEPAEHPSPRGWRGRLRPHWSSSRIPWIVTGGLGLAAVVAGLLSWSLHTMSTTREEQRGSITQYCLDMGGTAAQCQAFTGQSSSGAAADSAAAGDSLAS